MKKRSKKARTSEEHELRATLLAVRAKLRQALALSRRRRGGR